MAAEYYKGGNDSGQGMISGTVSRSKTYEFGRESQSRGENNKIGLFYSAIKGDYANYAPTDFAELKATYGSDYTFETLEFCIPRRSANNTLPLINYQRLNDLVPDIVAPGGYMPITTEAMGYLYTIQAPLTRPVYKYNKILDSVLVQRVATGTALQGLGYATNGVPVGYAYPPEYCQ